MRTAALSLILALSLGACSGERSLKVAPVVRASPDLNLVVRDVVFVGAQAQDADGEVASFAWSLVAAPDPSATQLTTKGRKGEVLELKTGGIPGHYVLSVTATDDDELVSEPDFINLTLRPEGATGLELICIDGCRSLPERLEANELSDLAIEVRPGPALGLTWAVELVRDTRDPFIDEPTMSDRSSGKTVRVPRVARPASLVVSASTAGGVQAQLVVDILNSVDEPPEIALEWSQPGQPPVGAQAPEVLPGDALWVSARVSDPNGDEVTCTFPEVEGLRAERRGSSDPCRITVYPLVGGTLQILASATTTEPTATAEAEPLEIEVAGFQVEQDGPSLDAVAIDRWGRIVAVGELPVFHIYSDGRRDSYLTGLTEGTAVAISSGGQKTLGFAGWASSGSWSAFDFTIGEQQPNFGWGVAVDPPTRTRAMAAGSHGRVFAATDRGIAFWDGTGSLAQWQPEEGLDVRAIAVGPDMSWGSGGLVWYAVGNEVYCQTTEDAASWTADAAVGTVAGPAVTAIGVGPTSLPDLWVGTGDAEGTAGGSGLWLFRDAFDPVIVQPRMEEGEAFFAQLGAVRSIAVERQGPYAGDAWGVVGDRLARVSRAQMNGGGKGAEAFELVWLPDVAPRSVAVSNGAARSVVLASSRGLVFAP
ncbi:MAG: hypothetical protein ACOX6T_22025 [Myxococcales bacterium]|jgi:hypothetical protein